MFQREAMWIAFHTTHSSRQHAVKIAVDGVNALTGLLQDESAEEKQDYLPVGNENGQLCASPFQFSLTGRAKSCLSSTDGW